MHDYIDLLEPFRSNRHSGDRPCHNLKLGFFAHLPKCCNIPAVLQALLAWQVEHASKQATQQANLLLQRQHARDGIESVGRDMYLSCDK